MADVVRSSGSNGRNRAPLTEEEQKERDERRKMARERNLFEIQHYGGRSFVAKCEATRPDFEMLQQLDFLYARLKGRAGEVRGIPFDKASKFINQHMDLLLAKSDLCKQLAKALGMKYREPSLIAEFRSIRNEAKRNEAQPSHQIESDKSLKQPSVQASGDDDIAPAPVYETATTEEP